MSRALRILFVANDGFSTGHVTRTLAIARGLSRGATARGIELATLLVTTSEADALLANQPIAVVRLPAPVRARLSGIGDGERRQLVRAAIDAVVDGFGPDLIVVDTFPSGPHGELAGLGRRAKRALIRRAVPDPQADLMTTGLGDYDAMIVADDAGATASTAAIRCVRVPPITLTEVAIDRASARRALGLPETGRAILVTAGGGGDEDAANRVRVVAAQIARTTRANRAAGDEAANQTRAVATIAGVDCSESSPAGARVGTDRSNGESPPAVARVGADRVRAEQSSPVELDGITVALALGPLDSAPADLPGVVTLRVAPLQPYLSAFDGAFSAAGYNTAHELAHAGVPTALFALPRPFDDQAARARRLAAAGFARVLDTLDDDAIASALGWMGEHRSPALAVDGADRAADALFDLVGVRG